MHKKHIAFVFARGGSKGVKNKNIRLVAGKPLIAHTIQTALKSKYISKVVVSTDSNKIAGVALEFGAEVLYRPDHIAQDNSPEILSWKHAIKNYEKDIDTVFISLPATSPLRLVADIDNAVETYTKNMPDILFGISPSHRNPYLNMVTINESNLIDILITGSNATRRQDVPDVFDITTSVYVGNSSYIKNCETLMEGQVGYVTIPIQRSLDIDTEFDLYLADLMLKTPFLQNGINNE